MGVKLVKLVKMTNYSDQEVPMLNVSEAKAKFSELVNRAAYGRERIVVGTRDKAKVAIIPIEDLDRLEELEEAQAAREGLEALSRGETIPWEQVKAELGLSEIDEKASEDEGDATVPD